MNTVIFGAGGQLARDLAIVFGEAGHAVTALGEETVDITHEPSVRDAIGDAAAEIVLNAAAYTDVEGAEDHAQAAFLVNADGARIVARAAGEVGADTVYFSTDYVFGGRKTTPYVEDDPLAPIGVYARSKAAGEEATRESTARHFILRTAWLYGPGGNNFVEKILRAAAARPSLRVVSDEVGSPTHTYDLAEAALALATTEAYGIYHAVNTGECSRYDFAREILRLAAVDIPVEACSSAEFPTKAERPLYSVLSTSKLETVTGHAMRPWQDGLRNYMERREIS